MFRKQNILKMVGDDDGPRPQMCPVSFKSGSTGPVTPATQKLKKEGLKFKASFLLKNKK